MNAPFQYVDYENERSKQMDELTKLAKQQQVSIAPAVLAGFPENTADVKQPALLWAALSFIDGLLTTALQCQVGAIHSLQMPLALTNAPVAVEGEALAEIPIQVDLTGTEPAVAKLLQLLPLRGDELKAAGQVQGPADKAPLFIDRLIIRKQSPDKPDEVRVSLRVVGFVLRE
jgi:hypothetical protein